MTTEALAEQKRALRRDLRTRRRRLHQAAADAALRAAEAFDDALVPRGAIASVYHAVEPELSAEPLARRLRGHDVAIALPVVVKRGAPLIFRLDVGEPLEPDEAGLLAPSAAAPVVRPRLVVLPLLAFDSRGARLGQGGGYYDRTLAELRRTGEVFALGLGYAGQEVEAVPTGPDDQRLDAVLTEAGLRLFERDIV